MNENKNIDNFNNATQIIEKYLSSENLDKYSIFQSGLNGVNYIYSKIKFQSIKLQNEEQFDKTFSDEDFKILKNNIFLQIEKAVLFHQLSIESKNFIYNFILLIFNWNDNLLKNSEIEYNCKKVLKIVESIFTMSDTINILKQLNNLVLEKIQNQIPAIELSKQYLELNNDNLKC